MNSANTCLCSELDELPVIGMGDPDRLDERVFATLHLAKKHGAAVWWLAAYECSACWQPWMVAQDERIHDNYCLKKLDRLTMQEIVENDDWPQGFITFEKVLRAERASGQIAKFLDTQCLSLVQTARELRERRPDISLDEIAHLLVLSVEDVNLLLD